MSDAPIRTSQTRSGYGRPFSAGSADGFVEVCEKPFRPPQEPIGLRRPPAIEQADSPDRDLRKYEYLIEAGSQQATGFYLPIAFEKTPLDAPQLLFPTRRIPPVKIGEELSEIQCGVRQRAGVEVDESDAALPHPDMVGFVVTVRQDRRLARQARFHGSGSLEDVIDGGSGGREKRFHMLGGARHCARLTGEGMRADIFE